MDWINVFLAFFEGVVLIISPCLLPILPVVLAGSLTGGKKRPLGIIIGFIVTFTLITLFSRVIIEVLHIETETLRTISFIILLLLASIMLSDALTEKFALVTQSFASVGSNLKSINEVSSGFMSGFLFGTLLGLIWTPCAGPLLAAVIVQIVIQKTTILAVFTLLAFAIGAGLPMLLIAFLGRKLVTQLSIFRRHMTWVRKILACAIIASVIYMIFGPRIILAEGGPSMPKTQQALLNGLKSPYPAPPFQGITAWINSKPLTIESLRGKVVLIDFWTYSCINCIRTLPYLKDWYVKYHHLGFEIIGVHSPEFAFERKLENVQAAVSKDGIRYPVALDSQFVTWQNYHNRYWPAHYLINQEGNVVYEHFGEGEYDVTENNIRYLLNLSGSREASKASLSGEMTGETYLGYDRADQFASPETVLRNQPIAYHYPKLLSQDSFALRGRWTVQADKIVAVDKNASIKLHFKAQHVYAVMGMNGQKNRIKVYLDNHLQKEIIVSKNDLYPLFDFAESQEHELELEAEDPGLELYTFTFG